MKLPTNTTINCWCSSSKKKNLTKYQRLKEYCICGTCHLLFQFLMQSHTKTTQNTGL